MTDKNVIGELKTIYKKLSNEQLEIIAIETYYDTYVVDDLILILIDVLEGKKPEKGQYA